MRVFPLLLAAFAVQTLTAQIRFGPPREIGGDLFHCRGVSFPDLDGDGDPDALGISFTTPVVAWYENLGGGRFGPQRVIGTEVLTGEVAEAADLDGDGDLDVVTASRDDDKVAWHENLGGGAFGPQRIIDSLADGAIDLFPADLDGDGDLDLAAALLNASAVVWYRNDGTGAFGEARPVTDNALLARHVHGADLDGDGRVDLLSASRGDDKIAWYRNLGGGFFGPQRVVSDAAVDARWVEDADLDGDGIPDLITASRNGNLVAWHRGLGGGVFGPQTPIGTAGEGSRCVTAGDLDGDGDLDLLSGSEFDDDYVFFENLGGGAFSAEGLISGFSDGPWRIFPVDIDGDGDLDAAAGVVQEHRMVWWPNRSGEEAANAPTWIELADGLDRPVDLDPDTDGRLVVAEQGGRVFRMEPNGRPRPPALIELGGRLLDDGPGTGLLAVALADPYLFVTGIGADSAWFLARYTVSGGVFDPATERVLLHERPANPRRMGRLLAFGEDSFLYVGLGDGGDATAEAAQDAGSRLGKLLRIDVAHPDSFRIPPGNPFVGDGAVDPAIYALGLRQPRGLVRDAASGRRFLTDDGWRAQQLYVADHPGDLAGRNLGWPCLDGDNPYLPAACGPAPPPEAPPFAYGAADGVDRGIGRGAWYAGAQMPGLEGRFLTADATTGDLYVLAASGPKGVVRGLRDGVMGWMALPDGEILALDHPGGRLLRLVQPCGAGGPVPGKRQEPDGPDGYALRWDPVPGAVRYRLELRTASGAPLVYDNDREGLIYRASGLLPGQPYAWTVEAQCADGSWSSAGTADTFIVGAPRLAGPQAATLRAWPEAGGWRVTLAGSVGPHARLLLHDAAGRLAGNWPAPGAGERYLPAAAPPSGWYRLTWTGPEGRAGVSVYRP